MDNKRQSFSLGWTCIVSFVVMTFIVPGVWGAIIGASPPTPWQMGGTWATWIASYVGVFLFTYVVAKAILRTLKRRKSQR